MPISLISYLFVLLFSMHHHNDDLHQESLFKSQKVSATLKTKKLEEASGLEYSSKNPNHFWSHNDSGGTPSIFLFDTSGVIVMEARLEGVINRDWEEITLEEKNDNSYLYIAEIGDNRAAHQWVSILKIEEPVFTGQYFVSIPRKSIEKMEFQYEEGARDAEALMFDYANNELVLITKREDRSMVYSFPFDPTEQLSIVSCLGTIPSRNFTAADASKDGEILLKNYNTVYYWSGDSLGVAENILRWNPEKIQYTPESQGEAICWSGADFYTISERNGSNQKLLFFERK